MENKIEQLPSIEIVWDADKQTTGLKFDVEKLKTWDMVCMILKNAVAQAEFNLNLARAQAIQQQQMNAMQNQMAAQKIMGNANRGRF